MSFFDRGSFFYADEKSFPPMEYSAFLLSGYIWRVLSNRISNTDTAPTFSITKAGAVFFSVSGNDDPRQISLAKPNIQIKPAAERKVMTMVAENKRYANRNMRQDRKVGKESV